MFTSDVRVQASAAGQMPVLPLQLSLAAAVTSAAVNAQHFRGRGHMQLSDSAARHLRQWLRFLGCIGIGLLAQVQCHFFVISLLGTEAACS